MAVYLYFTHYYILSCHFNSFFKSCKSEPQTVLKGGRVNEPVQQVLDLLEKRGVEAPRVFEWLLQLPEADVHVHGIYLFVKNDKKHKKLK